MYIVVVCFYSNHHSRINSVFLLNAWIVLKRDSCPDKGMVFGRNVNVNVKSPVSTGDIPLPPNHISNAIACFKGWCAPVCNKWDTLSLTTRYILIAVSMPFVIFPAVWLLLLGPSVLFLFALAYSAIYGFNVFIAHFEAALKEHFNVADEVHDKADQLKNTAGGVSDRVSTNILDILSLVFYTTIVYTMKILEFIISVLLVCTLMCLEAAGFVRNAQDPG